MKVYLVTEGTYSDYRVLGAYSSPEKAEQAKRLYGTDNGVGEYELDALPDHPEGMLSFYVHMGLSGRVVSVTPFNVEYGVADEWRPLCGYEMEIGERRGEEKAVFEVWAHDEEHAVKIANEKRLIAIASAEWRRKFDESRRLLDNRARKLAE